MKWWNRGWNPVSGCSKCSEGCENCYAEKLINKRLKAEKNLTFDIHINKKQLNKKFDNEKEFVFVCSQSDLFHHFVTEDVIDEVFDKITNAKNKKFAVCTKRSAYMKEYFNNPNLKERNYDNVMIGVTVENNKSKNRIEDLLECDLVKNKFLCLEPMLEEIDISKFLKTGKIDWVVVGCENGENARPCNIKWIEKIVKQSHKYNVPVFVNNINQDGIITDNIESTNVNYREFNNDFKN